MKRVLVVEDSKTLVTQVDWMLRCQGYDVHIAYDGLSALMSVRALVPDLVLLDVMLPNVSGLDVCATIRRNPICSDIPIILMSALKEEDYLEQAYAIGANAYIQKPFDEEEFLAVIKRHAYAEVA